MITQNASEGLPWWYSDKNQPSDAGDMGLIPGPGRLHMSQGNSPSLEPEKDCTQQQRPSTAKKILILKNASKVCGETESFMHQ